MNEYTEKDREYVRYCLRYAVRVLGKEKTLNYIDMLNSNGDIAVCPMCSIVHTAEVYNWPHVRPSTWTPETRTHVKHLQNGTTAETEDRKARFDEALTWTLNEHAETLRRLGEGA